MADLKEWRDPATSEDKVIITTHLPMLTIEKGEKNTRKGPYGSTKFKIIQGNMQSIKALPGGKQEVENANIISTDKDVDSDRG